MRLVLALLSTVVFTSAALAYVRYLTGGGSPIRWFVRDIEVSVAPMPTGLDPVQTRAAVEGAIAAWIAIDCDPPLTHTVSDEAAAIDEGDGRNSVVWFTSPAAWNQQFSAAELARTLIIHKVTSGTIVDADIAVNLGGFAFSAGPTCELGRYDLQGALTHEFGHFFGLDHSPVTSATMAARTDPADCEMRTLDGDDVAGFCATYDRPAEVEPEATPEGAVEPSPEVVEAVEVTRGADDGCGGAVTSGTTGWMALGGALLLAARLRRARRASV